MRPPVEHDHVCRVVLLAFTAVLQMRRRERRKMNKSHPGNLSGLRGTGSKERVGATVKRINLSKDVANALRFVCLQLYGKADVETSIRHVSNLILADEKLVNDKIESDSEKALNGEIL